MSAYREDREPCRECARREAEGPRQRWWQAIGLTWRRVALTCAVAWLGNLVLVGAKYAAWLAEQPPACHIVYEGHEQVCVSTEHRRLMSCHATLTDALAAARQLSCPVENR